MLIIRFSIPSLNNHVIIQQKANTNQIISYVNMTNVLMTIWNQIIMRNINNFGYVRRSLPYVNHLPYMAVNIIHCNVVTTEIMVSTWGIHPSFSEGSSLWWTLHLVQKEDEAQSEDNFIMTYYTLQHWLCSKCSRSSYNCRPLSSNKFFTIKMFQVQSNQQIFHHKASF
jgi:hypothetical protein